MHYFISQERCANGKVIEVAHVVVDTCLLFLSNISNVFFVVVEFKTFHFILLPFVFLGSIG